MKTKRNKHITNHRQSSKNRGGRNCTAHQQSRKKSAVNSVNYKIRANPCKMKTRKRVILTGGDNAFEKMRKQERKGINLFKPEPPSRPTSPKPKSLLTIPLQNPTPPKLPTNEPPPRPPKPSNPTAIQSSTGTLLVPPRPTSTKPTHLLVPSLESLSSVTQASNKGIPPPLIPMSVVKPNASIIAPPPPPPLPPPFSSVNPNTTKQAQGIPPAPPMPTSWQLKVPKQLRPAQGPGKPAGNNRQRGKQQSNSAALFAQIQKGYSLKPVNPPTNQKNGSSKSNVGKKGASTNFRIILEKAMEKRRLNINPNNKQNHELHETDWSE